MRLLPWKKVFISQLPFSLVELTIQFTCYTVIHVSWSKYYNTTRELIQKQTILVQYNNKIASERENLYLFYKKTPE